MNEYNSFSPAYESEAGLSKYIAKVFVRMGIALLITAVTAFLGFVMNDFVLDVVYGSGIGYLALIAIQFGICIALSAKLTTLSHPAASALFYVYAFITGITFSVLPLAFGMSTFFTAFLFASVLFFSCAIIGLTTKVDLSQFKGLLIGGLIALLITSILSLFIPLLRESLLVSYLGVILFLVLTAWDMQKVKQYYYGTAGGMGDFGENLATYGAFQLYLDFINIFLYVLRILGRNSRRD